MVFKVSVPLTRDGVRGWVFKLVCPGYAMSIYHDKLLLLKNATVNRNLGFDGVCNERHVNIAYWDKDLNFYVNENTGKLVEWKTYPVIGYGPVSLPWEVQAAFVKLNNIQPHWFNSTIMGSHNETTGQWSGPVGMIQRDEVDYAVLNTGGSQPKSKEFASAAVYQFAPDYFFTRYPRELSPIWNLTGLFTKG